MRTNGISKVMEPVEKKRMRYRCSVFGYCLPCGAYNGKSTIRRRLTGAWLVLHKARLMLTIPLHLLQSVAEEENTEYLFLRKRIVRDSPTYEKGIQREKWMLQKITENYKIKSA